MSSDNIMKSIGLVTFISKWGPSNAKEGKWEEAERIQAGAADILKWLYK